MDIVVSIAIKYPNYYVGRQRDLDKTERSETRPKTVKAFKTEIEATPVSRHLHRYEHVQAYLCIHINTSAIKDVRMK